MHSGQVVQKVNAARIFQEYSTSNRKRQSQMHHKGNLVIILLI